MRSTPSSKVGSSNNNNIPLERNANNGWKYYQYGDRLEGVDENGISHNFHLDGDNIWRDYTGHSVKEDNLWPKP